MPTTAILQMRALRGGRPPRSIHGLLHPALLERIRAADAGAAQTVHDGAAPGAFALSPLMRLRKKVNEGDACWARVGLLNPEMEDLFLSTLENGAWREPVALGDYPFQISEVILGAREGEPWSGQVRFDELVEHTAPIDHADVEIASPLAFKRGDVHYPVPEPELFFGNLLRRWNDVTPLPLPKTLEWEAVGISRLDLRTEPFALRRGGTVVGCKGRVRFVFRCDPAQKYLFHLLLRFAFFAGVGVKTAQGMGMCRMFSWENGHGRRR